jgi:hypothetical protein
MHTNKKAKVETWGGADVVLCKTSFSRLLLYTSLYAMRRYDLLWIEYAEPKINLSILIDRNNFRLELINISYYL